MFKLEQFPLPFAPDALAPHMSAETVHYHYGRHMATYIDNLNKLISGTKYEKKPLADIIIQSVVDGSAQKIFNNAAQVFNHAFFFRCLRADGGGDVPMRVADAFGGADKFKADFKEAALAVFGSGWTWLVRDNGKLRLVNTSNADTPMVHGIQPLLTLDVWEHAYYLDYQNRRGEFIDAFLDHLVNWDWVNENL